MFDRSHWRKPHPVAIYSCSTARHGLGPEGQLHEAVSINAGPCGSSASERSERPLASWYFKLSSTCAEESNEWHAALARDKGVGKVGHAMHQDAACTWHRKVIASTWDFEYDATQALGQSLSVSTLQPMLEYSLSMGQELAMTRHV